MLLPALSSRSWAQAAPADSSLLASTVQNMHQRYLTAVGGGAALYTGLLYTNYLPANSRGHQYFLSNEELNGSVRFNGYDFVNIPLQYDIRLDVLITNSYNSPVKLMLLSEEVESFTIDGHRFKRIVADPAAESSVTTGFYEVLYAGKSGLQALARHSKTTQDLLEQRVYYKVLINVDRYFIVRNGTYYPVAKKGSVLAAIGDRKKELKKYASEQKLAFSKEQRLASIVALTAYYDQLNQASAPGK
ncbi:hypothetical protein [Hymenobacter sp. CRA2]|uniref:hypothetical protein n=1 Tax=Hymenobacter sp. CRA2 TaxID=1955620 RepID=UPI00098FF57B|nr:hypothetical protein [Hymenobacter sp. CRA2]OON69609.1 hypothetical protein B0919_06635 [Hymenobacter sp. CRA2]